LLTGFEERRIELEDAVLAGDSGNATSPEWEAMLFEDPVFRRTAVALVFEPRLAVASKSPPSLSDLIIDSLLPSIKKGDGEALRIFFQALYRLSAYDVFLAQFKGIWSSRAMHDEVWIDLIGLAYQVAIILGEASARAVRRFA
jgi:hypothetical protein